MNPASSSFDEFQNTSSLPSAFSAVELITKNGATSDCYKVRIYGKWHFLKRPKKEFLSNPIYIAAFEKEFDLGFTLDHPNIVRYLNKGFDSEGNYILSEFVDGLSLTEFREQNPDFFNQKTNLEKFSSQLFSALAYLHARQIVHLDLKPDNMLITRNGHDVKLIDLGMSYSDCYTEITGGSPAFGSPEQFSNTSSISYRSDMFAAGNIILYATTGEINKQLFAKIPIPLRKIAKQCLLEDVGKRIITAEQCIDLIRTKSKPRVFVSISLLGFILITIFVLKNRSFDSESGVSKPNVDKLVDSTVDSKFGSEFGSEVNGSAVSSSRTGGLMITPRTTPTIITNNQNDQIASNLNNITNPIMEVNDEKLPTDSLNIIDEIRTSIRQRLLPNKATLEKVYSDVNEYNFSILKQSFDDWKAVCIADCNVLYQKYRAKIQQADFQKIYQQELDVLNNPIERKLDKYSGSVSN